MAGAILNALGILVGSLFGLFRKADVPALDQGLIKKGLGIFCIYAGLKITWEALGGGALHVLKQMAILMVGLILGKMVGRLLHFQAGSNRVGKYVANKLSATVVNKSDGVLVSTILFCAAPLAIFGSVLDGLRNYPYPLIIKGIMDGMASFAFTRTFGWNTMLSALPVLAFQGGITLLAKLSEPWLRENSLLEPTLAAAGLLVFCVSLVILEIKRIELADYIPSLIFVPMVARFFDW